MVKYNFQNEKVTPGAWRPSGLITHHGPWFEPC